MCVYWCVGGCVSLCVIYLVGFKVNTTFQICQQRDALNNNQPLQIILQFMNNAFLYYFFSYNHFPLNNFTDVKHGQEYSRLVLSLQFAYMKNETNVFWNEK